MSPFLVGFLLVLVLVVPVVGAVVLRMLHERMSQRVLFGVAALIVVLPMAGAIVLSRSNTENLRLGNLSVVLIEPTAVPLSSDVLDTLTVLPEDQDAGHVHDEATTTADVTPTPEDAATADVTATPEPPTATPEPPTATPEPPTPTPAPAPEQRRYTVQQGDTLKSIAEQFNVSVADLLAANGLTAAQADSLRVGQELIVP